ncbi:MAG TPA: helix-turn-helix domain-containing protein [Spirochaetota bacterium]|nr:helix-turn-helix domain-containing protein [Spirochaetota bacterium]
MEELGSYLKECRINQNLSIDKVVEETHIVRKFVEAIESEQFNAFPGEAYLKGFLRTYSEYLGLNAEDVIRRYEKIKLAESPLPMEQLIPKPSFDFKPFLVMFTIILLAGLVIFGIVFISINISKNIANTNPDKNNKTKTTVKKEETKKDEKKKEETIYTLTEKEKEFSLKKSDIVEFNIGAEKFSINVKEVNPTVIISDNKGKEYFLIKSYQQRLDVNSDNSNDIEIILNSWDNKVANITFKLNLTEESKIDKATDSVVNLQGENIETIGKKSLIEDIVFDMSIQNETFLRYQTDALDYIEGYYKAGTLINVKAQKSVILWFANAGAVTLNFKSFGKTLSPGDVGKIEVKNIKWVQNALGEYDLQISNLK